MTTPTHGMTIAASTIASAQIAAQEYVRLPPPGEHDPVFGLTRSYLNLLILPSKENDFRPPVRSSVLRQLHAKTGVRLVNVASLRAYLQHQFQASEAQPAVVAEAARLSELPAPNSSVEFIRLPKVRARDPLFGLSRSFLNELILPRPENKYQPPVRSHVLRRRGYRTGIRLISVDSLRDYILKNEEIGGVESNSAPEPPNSSGT
jgi:hypothetical protein